MITATRLAGFLLLLTCTGVLRGSPETGTASPQGEKDKAANSILERLRFVPGGGPWKGETASDGASWHNLRPGLTKGVLDMRGRAGLGDSFPVGVTDDTTLFTVKVVEGNDDQLTVEVNSEGLQKVVLKRDKAEEVEVTGLKYKLLYPSTSVAAAPGEKPTTNKATIFVSRKA
jgi:hypothetical protein